LVATTWAALADPLLMRARIGTTDNALEKEQVAFLTAWQSASPDPCASNSEGDTLIHTFYYLLRPTPQPQDMTCGQV